MNEKIPPRLKAPIIVLIPGATPDEVKIMQQFVIRAKDSNTFEDRLFIILDSDLAKTLLNKETLLALAKTMGELEDEYKRKNQL